MNEGVSKESRSMVDNGLENLGLIMTIREGYNNGGDIEKYLNHVIVVEVDVDASYSERGSVECHVDMVVPTCEFYFRSQYGDGLLLVFGPYDKVQEKANGDGAHMQDNFFKKAHEGDSYNVMPLAKCYVSQQG